MIKNKLKNLNQFLTKDIWKTSEEKFSFFKSFGLRQLKTVLLALRKFDQQHSRLQAASMTYYSILALVPSMTLLYGLMKGFGLEGTLKEQLDHNLPTHKELIDAIFNMAQAYVEKSHGTVFAGIGLALLLWGVFKTLTTIEEAFNDIWGIKEGKPILRKLSDYLAVFLICPLLLVCSGSAVVFISTQVHSIAQNFTYLGPLVPLIYAAFFFIPFLVIWLVFTFIYIFMPNTQVNFISALWGGFIAGTLYQVTQWSYIIFQVWINNANAIYGSLAAVPLFLVWLQLSWMILLFGAEISFARQYLKTYEFEPENITPSPSLRKLVALLITYRCVKDFERGEKPCTIQQIAEHLHIPARLAQQVTFDLVESNLLCKIYVDDNKIFAYHPARTINDIRLEDVINAIEHLGQEDIPIHESQEYKIISKHLEKLSGRFERKEQSLLLKNL